MLFVDLYICAFCMCSSLMPDISVLHQVVPATSSTTCILRTSLAEASSKLDDAGHV